MLWYFLEWSIVFISCMQFYLEREIKLHACFSSDVFEPRTSTGSWPFSILTCLDATKFVLLRVFTLMETICANICLKSRLKSAKVYVRLMCVTQKRCSFNSLITGLTDGPMSRLTQNFFRVVQILLDVAAIVSLRDY